MDLFLSIEFWINEVFLFIWYGIMYRFLIQGQGFGLGVLFIDFFVVDADVDLLSFIWYIIICHFLFEGKGLGFGGLGSGLGGSGFGVRV